MARDITRSRGEARWCEGAAWLPKAREMSSLEVGMKITLDRPDAAIFCSVSRIRICAPRPGRSADPGRWRRGTWERGGPEESGDGGGDRGKDGALIRFDWDWPALPQES